MLAHRICGARHRAAIIVTALGAAAALAQPPAEVLRLPAVDIAPAGSPAPANAAEVAGATATAVKGLTLTPPPEPRDDLPLAFTISYALYSDYVFRGVNYSDYDHESGEAANHQLNTEIALDVALLCGGQAGTGGTLAFATFFEWFAAQQALDPTSRHNLQEVDYALSWSYDVEPLATTLTLGYAFFTYPHASTVNTSEFSVRLDHNDAWLWQWAWPDNETGVLNPFVSYAHDFDYIAGAGWLETGISHPFEPVAHLTITPGLILATDVRYLGPTLTGDRDTGSTRLAYVQYGLGVDYDLSGALGLPQAAGTVTLSGMLYFNQALGNAKSDGSIEDELFGGFAIGWSF